jgi:hypothetical protein
MGFFFSDPKDHIKHNEIKKELKSFGLSEHQQRQALEHFEEHKRESYSRDHIHKIIMKGKEKSGDSLTSDQWGKIEKGMVGRIEGRIKPVNVTHKEASSKVTNIKEYHGLRENRIEIPKDEVKSEEPSEPSENREGRIDKAA